MDYLLNVWYGLVKFVDAMFGLGLQYSVYLILLVAVFVLLIPFFLMYLRALKRKILALKKELIYKYDYIFYLLALADYENLVLENKLGDISSFSVMKTIINSGGYGYVENYRVIRQSIVQFETFLGKGVVDEELWVHINKLYKKLKFKILVSKIIKILFLFFVLAIVGLVIYIFYIKS